MFESRTVLFLFVMTYILSVQSQDNIFTITPNNSICIGELVIITCYLYPPTANGYTTFALLSFNGSTPQTVSAINTQFGSIGYVATIVIPIMGDSTRIQLNITSFQVSDSNTLFGCHAVLSSDGSVTGVIESGTATLAVPPSPPVSLTADFNSPNCSGTVQLAWTPGASDRDIEMYFLSLNGVMIASLDPSERTYNHPTTLQRDMEYTYSVVAMSCAGNSMETSSPIDPPSSPNVTLSHTDTICSNVLMWFTPSSDRSITSYSVYRDGDSISNISHTSTDYTDSDRIGINTVYTYSVIAISCAGTSTSVDVNSTRIGGTSLDALAISYDNTANELFVDWTLNQPTQPITVTYNFSLVYSYTQLDITYPYDETEIFSQISNDTNYTQYLTVPTFSSNESVVLIITANLSITKQCNTPFSDGIVLTANTESTFIPPDLEIFPFVLAIGFIIAIIVVSVCLCCGSVLILTGVIVLIIYYVSKKKDSKKKSDKHELEPVEEQMYSQINKGNKKSKEKPVVEEKKIESLYADIDHTFSKPDTLKRPDPVEETLYAKVQPSVDGPSQ